jgi:Zn finger protein HypA/HybF involved in hydrogenase expression
MKYETAQFNIECSEGMFVGYTNGTTWNGWECPYFTKDVGIEIVKEFSSEECPAGYDPASDSFIFEREGNEEPDVFSGIDIEVSGKKIHVYAIGAQCWCWDKVDEGEGNCKVCREHNINWSDISDVENDKNSVTVSLTGVCDGCGAVHYAIVSGDIVLAKAE